MREVKKARIDRVPHAGEVVVLVRYKATDPDSVEIVFEPQRSFYARQLIARPRMLLGFAWRVAWINFKMLVKGKPRPIATVADRLGEEPF